MLNSTFQTYKYQKDDAAQPASFRDYWEAFVRDVPNRLCPLCGGVYQWDPTITVHQFGSVRVAHAVIYATDGKRSMNRLGSIVMWQGRALIASSRKSEEED